MLYVYEFLFTFFMAFFCSEISLKSTEQGLQIFFAFTLIYAVSRKSFANLSINLSFLVSAYRSIGEVLLCFLAIIAGSGLAFLALLALGYSRPIYQTDLTLWQVAVIEFIAALFITIVYYAMLVDLRLLNDYSAAVAVASIYGAFSIAFPHLPAGNFVKALLGLNKHMNILGGSIIGQLLGSIIGAIFYKTLICENDAIKKKEMDITARKANINF